MRIILVMVMSVDGKTTRGDESPNLWASPEDQDFFKKLKEKIGVLIMGRKTYEAAGQPHGDGIKRIVMSHHGPTPVEILKNLAKHGCQEALLVGGSEINGAFFADKLINEIYLTIEPKIFSEGLPLAQAIGHEVELELLNVRQLNPRGTLLLHYNVK